MDLSFDRAIITTPEEPAEELTAAEFLALPLHRRVRYVLQRKVEFFRGGTPVERSEALKGLMQHQGLTAT